MINYPYCEISGKISYPNPHAGYCALAKQSPRKSRIKSTGHYRCKDCQGIHMVTVDHKPKSSDN